MRNTILALAFGLASLSMATPVANALTKRVDGKCSALDPQVCVVDGVNHLCDGVCLLPPPSFHYLILLYRSLTIHILLWMFAQTPRSRAL
jgi:hypothetical protein